jgi:Ser/Thr protein kinase RdoA (MazF antagonist)
MHWPADHPLLTDVALRPFEPAAASVADGSRFVRVLRHLDGRRGATLSARESAGRTAVLKVFASPRARGNDRRLRELATSSAASIVPASLGVDRQGHAHLVSHHPGRELIELTDHDFVAACRRVGVALRRLHDCSAVLDRKWAWPQETAQLARQALPSTRGAVDELLDGAPDVDGADWVCAHRDCHPGQVIVEPTGDVRWIDLDDSAMAPRSLDVGNMVAHLRRENLRGARDVEVATAAERQFLDGYQAASAVAVADLDRWIDVAMLRLAALAAARHRDWPLHDDLLRARQWKSPIAPSGALVSP